MMQLRHAVNLDAMTGGCYFTPQMTESSRDFWSVLGLLVPFELISWIEAHFIISPKTKPVGSDVFSLYFRRWLFSDSIAVYLCPEWLN